METRKMMTMAAETTPRKRVYLWTNVREKDELYELWELEEVVAIASLTSEQEASRLGPGLFGTLDREAELKPAVSEEQVSADGASKKEGN